MTGVALAGDGDYDPEYLARLREDLRVVRDEIKTHMDRLRAEGLLESRTEDAARPAARPDRTAPTMIVLRPGDKVLVTLVEDVPEQEAQDVAATLRRSFPGVSFTVISGVAGICIQS